MKGKVVNFVDIDYEIQGNIACRGCNCIVCTTYLIAKPVFADVYCAITCPTGSYMFNDACL